MIFIIIDVCSVNIPTTFFGAYVIIRSPTSCMQNIKETINANFYYIKNDAIKQLY